MPKSNKKPGIYVDIVSDNGKMCGRYFPSYEALDAKEQSQIKGDFYAMNHPYMKRVFEKIIDNFEKYMNDTL